MIPRKMAMALKEVPNRGEVFFRQLKFRYQLVNVHLYLRVYTCMLQLASQTLK